MLPNNHPVLLSSASLAEQLGTVKVLDASSYLPTEQRDAHSEYLQQHIPGAVFFDIDLISASDNPLPHMFPSAAKFATEMDKLAISNQDRLVCYDSGKMTGACRAWWMLRAFGHQRVSVLDGGLRQWCSEQRATESGAYTPVSDSHFTAVFDATMLRSLKQVQTIIEDRSSQLLDARSAARFQGRAAEPRAGLRSGHMPGAYNLPYDHLLNENATFKTPDQLTQLFSNSGIDLTRPIVTTCGSGVSAATLLLGLHLIGHTDNALYDGSWAEWASRADTAVTTSA